MISNNQYLCHSIRLLLTLALTFCISSCNGKTGRNPRAGTNGSAEKTVPIDEKVLIRSNGTSLYAEIKGQDRTKPVVLFLHGGPGDVVLGLLPFQAYVGKHLEEDFVMVYLHQRGLVNSPTVPDSTQTIENHISDIQNVVQFLIDKFNRDKIILAGHSWGGLLGTLYLIRDDTRILKFVAIATPFDFKANNRESYERTMRWAKSVQKNDAIKELAEHAIPPMDSFEKLMVKSKWASQAYGGITKNLSMKDVINGTGYKEIKKEWQLKTMDVARAMFDALNEISIEDDINDISIPMLFIAGKNDANVPPTTVRRAFSRYQNQKEYVLFEKSHHLVFVDELEAFVATFEQFLSK